VSSYTYTLAAEGPLVPVSHAVTLVTSPDPVEIGLADVAELRALFARIPDPRRARGVRHGLASVLTVVVFAVLAGAGTFREAGARIADLPPMLHEAAGTRRCAGRFIAPSRDTVRRLLEAIDAQAADALVSAWVTARVRHRDQHCGLPGRYGLAIDGKTVSRSAGPWGPNVKLFSAMLHHEAVVIAQVRVPETTNEITQVPALLGHLDLTRAVITADAAHTQYDTAAYLRSRRAHYVLNVKGNQPALHQAIAAHFTTLRAPDHTTTERRGGRSVRRSIWIAATGQIAFPGVKQVFKILRERLGTWGQSIGYEIAYGITSLTARQAEPAHIAAWVRGHWGIENKTHWVRDVTLGEDAQHAYLGPSTHAMAVFRNLAIALIRLAGHQQIKATLQHIAADRHRILPLLAASHP
jgi:predicted transposase YbfD/YdcC